MVGVFSAVCRRITRRRPISPSLNDRGKDYTEKNDQDLKECLSTLDLVSLGVGSCCGTGMYLSCGLVTMEAGVSGAIIAFVVSGIAALLSGSCYAELASVCPKTSGSAYIYSYTTVGELIAFVIAWGLIAEYVIGAALASVVLSTTIDSMFNFVLKDYLSTWGSVGGREYFDVLAVVICVILTIVLISGVELSASINNILNLINLLVLLFFFIGISIYYSKISNWTSTDQSSKWGIKVLAQIPSAYFAFIGFDGIASTGGETKNPSKSIPKSVILSITICTLVYVTVSVCLSLIVPANQLPENTAMMDVFVLKNNYYAKYFISIGAVCGLFAAAFGSMFPLPRILCAMARDGLIHSHFGEICQKTKTPRPATLLTGILSITLAVTIDLNYLIELVLMGTLLAYILVAVSVLVLRYDKYSSSGYEPLETLTNVNGVDESHSDSDIGDITKICVEEHFKEIKQKRFYEKVFHQFQSVLRNCSPEVSKLKYTLFIILSVILCIQLTVCVLIVLLIRGVLSLNTVILSILTILFVILITLISILSTLPQTISHQSFRVPMVPLFPLLVTFVNIYFISSLSLYSWIIFSIWMFIGFIVYFTFSIRGEVLKSRDFQSK